MTIDWSSAPDDAIAIGERLKVLPAGSTQAYREGADVTQVAPSRTSEQQLAKSPQLREYLLKRITTTQDGRPCPAQVAPMQDFVANGARIVASCPRPVSEVDITIAMLTDIHEAYRTFAVGQKSSPAQFVYTLQQPSQRWRFGAAAAQQAPEQGGVPLIAAAAVLLAALAAGLWWTWRGRRSRAALSAR